MSVVFLSTFVLCLFALNGCGSSVTASCATGWFGATCQYKCHCTNNNCDSNGECRTGSTCVVEWFGPACQYQDLFSLRSTVTVPAAAVLKDRNDNTCVDSAISSLTVRFNMSYPLTWIRLVFKQPGTLNKVTMTFRQNQNVIHHCNLTSRRNEMTLDSFCGNSIAADHVIAEGQGLNALCSLYISGGRNVALKQRSFQSSIYKEDGISVDASNAVDGNRASYLPDNSCTHTATTDPAPQWNLTLARPHWVNRYDIYNRDPNGQRLFDFIMAGLSPGGQIVFNSTIPRINQTLYSMMSTPSVISGVKVYTTQRDKILSLCEVEIYGDSVCDGFKYGLECTKSCNCENKTETCHVATGGCPSGCASGFYGEDCLTPCPALTWGVDCGQECSVHCINQTCHPVTGVCDYGCKVGYSGDTCTYECPDLTWGNNCSELCSSQCLNMTCNSITGVCNYGCNPGYLGDNCIEECPPMTWGVLCLNTCNSRCLNKTCIPNDGQCKHGCEAGYTGYNCDETTTVPDVTDPSCLAMTWGDSCDKPCGEKCVTKTCHRASGDCDIERQDHDVGGKCLKGFFNEDRLGMGIGIGVVIGFFVCATIVGVTALIFRRRQRKMKRRVIFDSCRALSYNDYNQRGDNKKNSMAYESAAHKNPTTESHDVGEIGVC